MIQKKENSTLETKVEVDDKKAQELAKHLNQEGSQGLKKTGKEPYSVEADKEEKIFKFLCEEEEHFRIEDHVFKTTHSDKDVFTDILITYKNLNNNYLPSIKPAPGTEKIWKQACRDVGYDNEQIEKIFNKPQNQLRLNQ